MTQSRFFQIALSFPVVLWLVCLLVFTAIGRDGSDPAMKNLQDAYRIFLPYLIFAAAVWRLAANRSYRILMLLAFAVPLVWGVFFTFFYMATAFIKDHTVDRWYVLLMMAFWATVVAYLFEVIPYIILSFFKQDFRAGPSEQAGKFGLGGAPSLPENSEPGHN